MSENWEALVAVAKRSINDWMTIKKIEVKKNYTKISNCILRDKELSMKEKGLYCTLYGLPDGWKFSLSGLAAITLEGVDSLRTSIEKLEKHGYITWKKNRTKDGKYSSDLELFLDRKKISSVLLQEEKDITSSRMKIDRKNHDGKSVMVDPSEGIHNDVPMVENSVEYNKYYTDKRKNTDNDRSLNQSMDDRLREIDACQKLIASNIDLRTLMDTAAKHNETEVRMVNEIYNVICDMVAIPRKSVKIKDMIYPWEQVRKQFLELTYSHVADVLNRIVDPDLQINNISAYLISTLYMQSLGGTIKEQTKMYDEYLQFLRGEPY